jgi:hypothetical protein
LNLAHDLKMIPEDKILVRAGAQRARWTSSQPQATRSRLLRLRYTSTLWNGEKHSSGYRIELTATPQPFGGKQWGFVSPKAGAVVWKLYLLGGAVAFASREHYRIAYRCRGPAAALAAKEAPGLQYLNEDDFVGQAQFIEGPCDGRIVGQRR